MKDVVAIGDNELGKLASRFGHCNLLAIGQYRYVFLERCTDCFGELAADIRQPNRGLPTTIESSVNKAGEIRLDALYRRETVGEVGRRMGHATLLAKDARDATRISSFRQAKAERS
ncbi:MAG: hypothetical protein ABI395_02270 [Sphingobium sp.]